MRLLLDNNVFRSLTHTKGQGNLQKFFQELKTAGFDQNGGHSLTLTPFSIIEAIGIVVPSPQLVLPESAPKPGEEEQLADYLLSQALDFFDHLPELSQSFLLAKADEQRNFTKQGALAFFDRCVTAVLVRPEARLHIVACFAADALFKYPFPPDFAARMHVYFLAMLFSRDEIDNSVSLFRVMKRIWDNLYSQIYLDQQSFNRDRVQEALDRMSLKNDRDYLDCDLVHFLCVGHVTGDRRVPVIAFTTDDFNAVATRIAVFKAIEEQFRSQALAITKRRAEEAVMHEQGTLVICSSTAQILRITPVRRILAFDTSAPSHAK